MVVQNNQEDMFQVKSLLQGDKLLGPDVKLNNVYTFISYLQMAASQAIRQNTKMEALLLFCKVWELQRAATMANAN